MSQVIRNKVIHRQRVGDWVCQGCNNMNFAFRSTCNRCQADKDIQQPEEKGFKSALFLTESNGDIPPFSDRSADRSFIENQLIEEKTEVGKNFQLDKLPSIEPLLKQAKRDSQYKNYKLFDFEWNCPKCQGSNQYYKYQCNWCGYQRTRKLTA